MIERLGVVLFWLCCFVGALFIFGAIVVLWEPHGDRTVVDVLLVGSVLAYGLGRGLRYLFAGR